MGPIFTNSVQMQNLNVRILLLTLELVLETIVEDP